MNSYLFALTRLEPSLQNILMLHASMDLAGCRQKFSKEGEVSFQGPAGDGRPDSL